MHNVGNIKKAVAELGAQELSRFREWFEEFDAAVWDKQLEADAKSGKLDGLAERALADFKAGRYKKL